MDFAVNATLDDGGGCVLSLVGALDLASRDSLLDAGAAALADPGTETLTLEMSGVSFCDSSGVGAIVKLGGDAEDSGRNFVLRSPSSRVFRILAIAGLADAWPVEDLDKG